MAANLRKRISQLTKILVKHVNSLHCSYLTYFTRSIFTARRYKAYAKLKASIESGNTVENKKEVSVNIKTSKYVAEKHGYKGENDTDNPFRDQHVLPAERVEKFKPDHLDVINQEHVHERTSSARAVEDDFGNGEAVDEYETRIKQMFQAAQEEEAEEEYKRLDDTKSIPIEG
jgi:hypothetical protein